MQYYALVKHNIHHTSRKVFRCYPVVFQNIISWRVLSLLLSLDYLLLEALNFLHLLTSCLTGNFEAQNLFAAFSCLMRTPISDILKKKSL